MPENFKALRFPQDLGTNSSPNYITFMPEELSYEPTNYGNKADRGSGGLFGKSDGGSAFDIDLGAGNPFKQIGKAIGGQLESIADTAVDTVKPHVDETHLVPPRLKSVYEKSIRNTY